MDCWTALAFERMVTSRRHTGTRQATWWAPRARGRAAPIFSRKRINVFRPHNGRLTTLPTHVYRSWLAVKRSPTALTRSAAHEVQRTLHTHASLRYKHALCGHRTRQGAASLRHRSAELHLGSAASAPCRGAQNAMPRARGIGFFLLFREPLMGFARF